MPTGIYKRGPVSLKTRRKIGLAHKGRRHTKEQNKAQSQRMKGKYLAENHPGWKGNNIGNKAFHLWIVKLKGRPKKCELCGDTSRTVYDWANKNHKYTRNPKDYLRLCRSCHRQWDVEHNHYRGACVKGIAHGNKR